MVVTPRGDWSVGLLHENFTRSKSQDIKKLSPSPLAWVGKRSKVGVCPGNKDVALK
jgi:hypothetical protein